MFNLKSFCIILLSITLFSNISYGLSKNPWNELNSDQAIINLYQKHYRRNSIKENEKSFFINDYTKEINSSKKTTKTYHKKTINLSSNPWTNPNQYNALNHVYQKQQRRNLIKKLDESIYTPIDSTIPTAPAIIVYIPVYVPENKQPNFFDKLISKYGVSPQKQVPLRTITITHRKRIMYPKKIVAPRSQVARSNPGQPSTLLSSLLSLSNSVQSSSSFKQQSPELNYFVKLNKLMNTATKHFEKTIDTVVKTLR